MIATIFQLFGVVSLATLILTACSRYLCEVAIGLLRRQQQRLVALRCGSALFVRGYRRSLKSQRLIVVVMER